MRIGKLTATNADLHDPDPDLERRKSTPGPCLQRTPLTEFRNSGPTDLNRYGAWSFANVLNTASLIIIVTILVGIFGGSVPALLLSLPTSRFASQLADLSTRAHGDLGRLRD